MVTAKKQKLLDAALALFVEQGISETSTASIAKRASVATGTLFHHFENKKVLVEALYFHLKTSLVDDLALDGKIENEEQIVSLWHKVIIWGLDNPDKMAFFSIYYSSPWVESSFKHNVLNSVFSFLIEFIERQKAVGAFIDLPTDYIAMHIQQSLLNTVNYLLEHNLDVTSELIDSSLKVCLFGLQAQRNKEA